MSKKESTPTSIFFIFILHFDNIHIYPKTTTLSFNKQNKHFNDDCEQTRLWTTSNYTVVINGVQIVMTNQ